MNTNLKFPIGECPIINYPVSQNHINEWVECLRSFPVLLETLTSDLNREQLKWRYRTGGWNIKQVVHHCADSHMNSIIRFKWALTENTPEIKAYYEAKWAELPDSLDLPLEASIQILKGVHAKMVYIIENLSMQKLSETKLYHPEHQSYLSLLEMVNMYAWHSKHHYAHIEQALVHKW